MWGLGEADKSCTKWFETAGKNGHKFKYQHWLWTNKKWDLLLQTEKKTITGKQ